MITLLCLQVSASRFFGGDVVYVRFCDAETALFDSTAAGALAPWRDGVEICGVGGVAEVEGSGGGDGIAKALIDMSWSAGVCYIPRNLYRLWIPYSSPSGPDAIEHVCPKSNRHDKIFRVTDTHNIAWLCVRKPIRTGINSVDLVS